VAGVVLYNKLGRGPKRRETQCSEWSDQIPIQDYVLYMSLYISKDLSERSE